MSGGQSQSYQMTLKEGQYIHIVVDQIGIDVVVVLFGPDDKKLAEVDSPNGMYGPELVYAVTEIPGIHRLEVRALELRAAAGRYRVRVQELRTATERDRILNGARKDLLDAQLLQVEATPNSVPEVIKKYEAALIIFRAHKDESYEAAALNSLGSVYFALGELEKALEYYSQAVQLFHRLESKGDEASTLNNSGYIYYSLNQYQKALELYRRALSIVQDLNSPLEEARTLNYIALVYHTLGENRSAVDYDLQALARIRSARDRNYEAAILSNIGFSYYSLGENVKALSYYQRAILLYGSVGDQVGEAYVLGNVAAVHVKLGDKPRALQYYERAILIFRKLGLRPDEARTLNAIGLIFGDLGDKQRALDYFQRALTLYRDLKERLGEATTLNNIGAAYSSLGDKDKALIIFAQALALKATEPDPNLDARISLDRPSAKQKAFDYLQALPLKRAAGDLNAEAKYLKDLMSVYEAANNPRFAVFYGKELLRVYQQIRVGSRGSDARQTYMRSIEPIHRGLAITLINQHRYAEAQETLATLNNQRFFDVDNDQSREPKPLTRTPREEEFGKRLQRLIDEMGTIDTQIAEIKRLGSNQSNGDNTTGLLRLDIQKKAATEELLRLLDEAEADFSHQSAETDSPIQVPMLIDLQQALRQLELQTRNKTVAIYTVIGQERFYALLVTSEDITSVSSPITAEELNRKALYLWALLQSADYDPRKLSHELYDAIFRPIEEKLPKDTKTLMWSLDGNLRYLPMSALYDGNQYLVERYNNVGFTLTDRNRWTRDVSATWTGYGFASHGRHKVLLGGEQFDFAPMIFGETEMKIFRTSENPNGVINGDVVDENRFTRALFFELLKERRSVVHISSHFRFVPGDPGASFLVFGNNEFMTLAELRQHSKLFEGVELLTLSGCNTASQRRGTADQATDALSELAQSLGADAVLASLWAVLDISTAQLMNAFYTRHQLGGQSKGEALREAQLDLLYGRTESARPSRGGATDIDIMVDSKYRVPFKIEGEKPFAHPYYWAPFVLLGNWK